MGDEAPKAETAPTPEAKEPASLLGDAAPAKEPAPAAEGEAKSEGEAAKSEAAPAADIALKLPEGFVADEALLGEFKPLAKELGLDSAKAQRLFDLYAKADQARAQAYQTQLEQQVKGWVEAVKADKEIGGTNLEATTKAAQRAARQFGGDELLQVMAETGLGNHPAVVRAFARIGRALAEDSSAGSLGGQAPTAATDEGAFLKQMYPNTKF